MDENVLLDEKDRKILSELNMDARQTDSSIAKKVGLSKQVTNYRIQKLINRGVIQDFYTILDLGKLGFKSYYVFLQLENIGGEQEKRLISRLVSEKYVGWVVSGTGRWDIVLLIYARNLSEFDRFLNQTLTLCKNHLHEYTFTTLLFSEHLNYKFFSETLNRKSAKQTEEQGNLSSLVSDEINILKSLSRDARKSLVSVSEEIKIPVHVVNYRLREMVRKKIIEGFKPKINTGLLGIQWHLLLLQFKPSSEIRKKEFLDFCKNHKKIYYVTNTLGNYHLMLDIHVKSTEEFKEVLFQLKERFSDIIKLYESIIIFNEHKISYFPKEMYSEKN